MLKLPTSTKMTIYYPANNRELEKQSKYGSVEIMTLKKFLQLIDEQPLNFINYTELIILHDGRIILAEPSHTIIMHNLVRFATKGTNFDFSIAYYSEEILALSKTISVWNKIQKIYNFDDISDEQMEVLNCLIQNKLITLNLVTTHPDLRQRFESDFENRYNKTVESLLKENLPDYI